MSTSVNNDVEHGGGDYASMPLLPLAVDSAEHAIQAGDDENKSRYSPHRGWACAFKVNVLVTVLAAFWFGFEGLEALANDSLSGQGRRRLMHNEHGDDHSHHHHYHNGGEGEEGHGGVHLSNVIVGGVALLGIASLVSFGMLHSLFRCGRGFLAASYAVFVGIFGAAAGVMFLVGAVPAAVMFSVVFVFGLVALRRRKHRFAFGSANLKVASMAIRDMPWTYRSAILMGIVQFLWCVVAAIAALGSFVALETVAAPDGSSHRAIYCFESADSCMCNGTKISDGECEFSGLGLPLMIVWLCSMAWGCGVIRNVVACTVSGSVASWWFTPEEDPTPVKGAFHRATTSSFGSLCKAAAIQQLVAAACKVAQRVLRYVPCATTLLAWVNKAASYVLAYTVAFVGIYGLSFNEAGGRVREMFQRRAVTTLANDIVVEVGLRLLALSATVVYVLLTGVMMFGAFMRVDGDSSMVDSVEFWSIVGPQIFGVVALAFLVSTVLEVVRSGFKAVFVCFVQDPEVLAEKHGHEVHAELQSAWQHMHGTSQENGDGQSAIGQSQ
ncbi:unnamed protein product [Ectocarpus sp. CCAP 1310/34]|nr:unnamed protein product [Ectocarpus sp. CCAP 1310/34]